MSETPTAKIETKAAANPYQDSPIIHRICEACNGMFVIHAADPSHRCQPCHK